MIFKRIFENIEEEEMRRRRRRTSQGGLPQAAREGEAMGGCQGASLGAGDQGIPALEATH